jgi:hypothetical protein
MMIGIGIGLTANGGATIEPEPRFLFIPSGADSLVTADSLTFKVRA